MIPYTDFLELVSDAMDCRSLDEYINECGGSVPLDDVDEVIKLLRAIWSMAHDGLNIKSIAQTCGLSVRQIGTRFKLPCRTIEAWSAGTRVPPPWLLPLIAYTSLSIAET